MSKGCRYHRKSRLLCSGEVVHLALANEGGTSLLILVNPAPCIICKLHVGWQLLPAVQLPGQLLAVLVMHAGDLHSNLDVHTYHAIVAMGAQLLGRTQQCQVMGGAFAWAGLGLEGKGAWGWRMVGALEEGW